MSIEFRTPSIIIEKEVYLDGKKVGLIQTDTIQHRVYYVPIGGKPGESFGSVGACMDSVKGEG